jgi:hypothetical protein
LTCDLLKPYKKILFLVHPFFHLKFLIQGLKTNKPQNIFKNPNLRNLIKYGTNEEFELWKHELGFSRNSQEWDAINLRDIFISFAKYKQMYIKYRKILKAQKSESCLSIIIPIENPLTNLPKPLQKRYRDFAKIQNVCIPEPANIENIERYYVQPNM